MRKYIFFILLTIVVSGCSSSDDDQTISFTISSKNVADDSYVKGGVYRVSDSQNNTIGTYTLNDGTLKVSNLPENNYVIEEITSPQGYANVQEGQKLEYLTTGNNSSEFVFLYVNESTREIPKSINVRFKIEGSPLDFGEYNAVRIGEYYWLSRNFNHVISEGMDYENSHPITQSLLDKYLTQIDINPSKYQLENINDFEKYYGRYYSYPSTLYMKDKGYMLNQYNQKDNGWKLPSHADYRQLFAMSPFNTSFDPPHTTLNERDVRFALAPKPNDNPLAYDIVETSQYEVYWFAAEYATNMYNFGLMPGGARLNGPGRWCNGIDCYDGVKGDIYGLFYTAYFAVNIPDDPLAIGAVGIEDRVDTNNKLSYHFMNVRWCRQLTDAELGYKLYINSGQTDIKKLGLNEAVPDGYKELPHGYVRGFYVQYILDNPNPTVTVKDIVNYSREVNDNYIKENNSNTNIIF